VTNYVFIESRGPFDPNGSRFIVEALTGLKRLDNQVTVFLVQNGVLGARRNARHSHLPALTRAGVKVLADDFSLRERGIQSVELFPEVQPSSVDALVDLLVHNATKAVWH